MAHRWGIAARVSALCALFFLEKLLLNHYVDFESAIASQGLGALVRTAQHHVFRFLVAFVAATALFAYVNGLDRLAAADKAIRGAPLRWPWLAAHALLLAGLVPLSFYLYRDNLAPLGFSLIASLLVVAGGAAAFTALLGLAPLRNWWAAFRALRASILYGAGAAAVAAAAIELSQVLWAPTAGLTFSLVRLTLLPFLPDLRTDGATRILQSDRFAVEVSGECSGLEGIGLVLAFTCAWLLCFRREFIFPRALVLVPIGVLLIFVLNVLRIAVLFAIGHAGLADAAVYGFHSQAGWIAFISVACGVVWYSRRSVWLTGQHYLPDRTLPAENPVSFYLVPMIAILSAGVASHVLAAGFEVFYPLRLLAGAAALYYFRADLRTLAWRPGLPAVLVGGGTFAVWLASAHQSLPPASYPNALQAMSPGPQAFWIASRVITSVALVPIAEELAYRGFLMRRLQTTEFERMQYRSVSFWPIALSSLAFGAAHGAMWLSATVAGLAYGWVARRQNGIAAAIWAHGTTNALVAVWVLAGGRWELW